MTDFGPKITGFCCDWVADSVIKLLKVNQIQYFSNPSLLPLTCCGIITPETILANGHVAVSVPGI
jgi:coenzyme F420-reducing hydrogenase delta subunit